MAEVRYVRIWADEEGETHFAEAEVEVEPLDYAPPAPPLNMSAFVPTARLAFSRLPPGWYGDWHPTPRPQFYITCAGEGEIGTSDGEVRQFGPGSILLVEDTSGKGHRSRVTGTEDWQALFIQLAE